MHYLSLHLLVTSLILSFSLASTTTTSINPATTLKPKTSHLTCSQIYCGSSITCSDSGSSEFRYDPTLGESCCFLDRGFCLDGNFCENEEDEEICAERLGFTITSTSASAIFLTSSRTASCPLTMRVVRPVIQTTSITTTLISTSTISLALAETTQTVNAKPGMATGNVSSAVRGSFSLPNYEGKAERVEVGLIGLMGVVVVLFTVLGL